MSGVGMQVLSSPGIKTRHILTFKKTWKLYSATEAYQAAWEHGQQGLI